MVNRILQRLFWWLISTFATFASGIFRYGMLLFKRITDFEPTKIFRVSFYGTIDE